VLPNMRWSEICISASRVGVCFLQVYWTGKWSKSYH
jgi:hypothetical protein